MINLVNFRVRVTPSIKVDMIPDFNHDRKIDDADKTALAANGPFRFWINDDDDSGYDGGDDIPGRSGGLFGSANYKNNEVDGVRDLVDFFPVYIDIAQAVTVLPKESYSYFIKQAGGAINGVPTTYLRGYTDDAANQAGAYLIRQDVAERFVASDVILKQITSGGVEISEKYLIDAETTGKGFVLLCEGRASTEKPLVLEIRKKIGGSVVHTSEMPLSLSGVENMFRHKNFISVADNGEQPKTVADRDIAEHYPDVLCSEKWLIFLAGVNVDEQNSRGWQSEMFKRFYWSGSKAKFVGITYHAAEGSSANYQHNLNHAFQTASNVAQYVNGLNGAVADKVVVAHSMGNIVASSAITDHQMAVSKYLLVDAAVATEAYDASTYNNATNNNVMMHPEWSQYASRTWASEWHKLFLNNVDDARTNLTWKGRFSPAVSCAYNFFSSEDQVFEIYGDVLYMTTGLELVFGWPIVQGEDRYAWHKQELFKGRSSTILLGSTDFAGWGFRQRIIDLGDGTTTLERYYSSEVANLLSSNELINVSVFLDNPAEMFSSSISRADQNNILAQGIPALSFVTGRNRLNLLGDAGNFDMSALYKNGWPRNHPIYEQKWLHNDIREMAYLYIYEAFNAMVNEGGLK